MMNTYIVTTPQGDYKVSAKAMGLADGGVLCLYGNNEKEDCLFIVFAYGQWYSCIKS